MSSVPVSRRELEAQVDRRQAAIALAIAALTALMLGGIMAARLTLFTGISATPDDLQPGKASPVTILAPDRVSFASPLDTAAAQDQAAKAVNDVYDPPDADVAREQVRRATRIMGFLDTVRADPFSTADQKADWILSVPGAQVSRAVVSGTLGLEATAYRQVISETLYVIDQAMRDEIRENDLEAARKKSWLAGESGSLCSTSGFGKWLGGFFHRAQYKIECRKDRFSSPIRACRGRSCLSNNRKGPGGGARR